MEHQADIYDVIVVGAGIEGSSTAYQLSKRGKHVLLLDQFPLPHNRGSSHGQSRIIRKAYGAKDFYTVMMKESYTLIDQLQEETGEQFFVNCGCLVFGDKDNDYVKATELSLKRHDVPHELLDIQEINRRYPNFSVSDNFRFVLDTSAGILRSDKMLQAYQTLFKNNGGILRDREQMIDLHPGDVVEVKTNTGVYRGHSVVLTLGPWAAKFLPRIGVDVPLRPVRITVCYWKAKHDDEFHIRKFPAFKQVTEGGVNNIYGLPTEEYPGLVKICLHRGPDVDPDNRDSVDASWVVDRITSHVTRLFPTLQHRPSIIETCIYTNTPDEDFILDVHPAWNNVVIGAGFSGHGFKLAPVVGRILTDLSTGQKPTYDMTPFTIQRFFKNKL